MVPHGKCVNLRSTDPIHLQIVMRLSARFSACTRSFVSSPLYRGQLAPLKGRG